MSARCHRLVQAFVTIRRHENSTGHRKAGSLLVGRGRCPIGSVQRKGERRLQEKYPFAILRSNKITGNSSLCDVEVRITHRMKWSRRSELNRRPADYGSAALPTELRRLRNNRLIKKWSGRRDSDPRQLPWQGSALPLSYSRSGGIEGI